MENKSFDNMTVFRSFLDATRDLPAEQFKEAWLAILSYGFDGAEEDLSPVAKMFFTMAKPVIDKGRTKKTSASTGGSSTKESKPEANDKQTVSKSEANGKQTESKQEANDNRIKNRNRNRSKEEDKELDKENELEWDLEESPLNPPEGTEEPDGSLSSSVSEIVSDLNDVAGTHYRTSKTTTNMIKARLKEGYTVEDFKTVHRKKAAEWLGTEQQQYLRPETLYRPSHFESYLNQPERINKNVYNKASPAFDMNEFLMSQIGSTA